MHFSFAIAREGQIRPAFRAKQGVDIQWAHTDSLGNPDLAASQAAARTKWFKDMGSNSGRFLDSRISRGWRST